MPRHTHDKCPDMTDEKCESGERRPGRFKGKIRIAIDFDQTPQELEDDFQADLPHISQKIK